MTNANLTIYQKGAYYTWTKLFNTLPSNIKHFNQDTYHDDTKVFKPQLKMYLLSHSYAV